MSRLIIRLAVLVVVMLSVCVSLAMWHGQSLDSWTVIYTQFVSPGNQELTVIDANRALGNVLISLPQSTRDIAMSPDDRYVLGTYNRSWILYDTYTGGSFILHPIGTPLNDSPAWSADSRYLALPSGSTRGIYVYEISEFDDTYLLDRTSISLNDAGQVMGFMWGQETYDISFSQIYQNNYSTVPPLVIVHANVDGNIVEQIPVQLDTPDIIRDAVFSSNGRYFAYADVNGLLHVDDLVNGTRVTVSDMPLTDSFNDTSWSPDGEQLILYDAPERELYFIDIETGENERLQLSIDENDTPTMARRYTLQWSPNGEQFALYGENSTDLYIINYETRAYERAWHSSSVMDLHWSPNSRYIAIIAVVGDGGYGEPPLALHIIDTSNDYDEISSVQVGSVDVLWSPDSSQIIYTSIQTGQLMVLDVESGSTRQLTHAQYSLELVP